MYVKIFITFPILRIKCTSLEPSTCRWSLTPAATQRKAATSSSCPAAVTSSRMSTTSAELLRNGRTLRYLVRITHVRTVFKTSCVSYHLSIKRLLVSLRWHPVLQVHVWHEQHRVGLQVHSNRGPQGPIPNRCFGNGRETDFVCWISLILCHPPPIRVWDPEADVSRRSSAQSAAAGWHLGVASGRGLSSDRKPAS